MLYLKTPSQIDLDCYSKDVIEKVTKIRNTKSVNINNVLDNNKLKEILTAEPAKLIIFHNDIMSRLIQGFNDKEFNDYLDIKKKDDIINKTNPEQYLIGKYNITKDLFEIFNYDKFISKCKNTSYYLANKLNSNTCTYCNRLYTNTVIKKGIRNNDEKITRPQFDHWFAKSKYPILALSFFNLIPSCSVCNSSIKGNTSFSLDQHIHPYIKEINQDFTFSFRSKSVDENNVKIIVNQGSKIANTLNEFKINEVYNAHSMFELKDLIQLRLKYSENYLDMLLNHTFDNFQISKEEIYRLIFGVEIKEENYSKRPFSKFKKDIIEELLELD